MGEAVFRIQPLTLAAPRVPLMFLPHFEVLCDLLLNRRTATWNLFVLYNKEIKKF